MAVALLTESSGAERGEKKRWVHGDGEAYVPIHFFGSDTHGYKSIKKLS